jgi:hypothetical protein
VADLAGGGRGSRRQSVCACGGEKGTKTSGRGEWVGWIGFRWIGLAWENLPVGYANSVRHGYKVICGVHKFCIPQVNLVGLGIS